MFQIQAATEVRSIRLKYSQPSFLLIQLSQRKGGSLILIYINCFPPPLQWHLIYIEMKCQFEWYWHSCCIIKSYCYFHSVLIMSCLWMVFSSFTKNKQKACLTKHWTVFNVLHALFEPRIFPFGIQGSPFPSCFLASSSPPAQSPSPASKLGQLNRVGTEQFAGVVEMRDKGWSQTGGGEAEHRRRFPKLHPRAVEVFVSCHVWCGDRAFVTPPPMASTTLSRQMKSTFREEK